MPPGREHGNTDRDMHSESHGHHHLKPLSRAAAGLRQGKPGSVPL